MKPTILLYGNCQTEDLQKVAKYIPCLRDRVSFDVLLGYGEDVPDWDMRYGPDLLKNVRVVWEQVEAAPATEHRKELHRRLPADCEIVKFPPYSMGALWPFAGNDPRLAQSKRYAWPDSIAAGLAGSDMSDDDLFDEYMRLTTEKMPDLARRLRFDINRWKATDELSDIKLADYVAGNFRRIQMFYTIGHVSAEPMRRVMIELLARTKLIPQELVLQAQREVGIMLRHHRGQDFEMVPIHPLVAERLDLRYYDPDALYHWRGHEWSFKEYTINYIRWADYLL